MTSQYNENLRIAKMAYKEIKAIIDKFESLEGNEIHCCWDECIWVNDDFYQYSALNEKDTVNGGG